MSTSPSAHSQAGAPPARPAPGEAEEPPLRLPRRAGHGPRVAVLVYNDAHNDARVIKEATALREAGAEVRVFAVAREAAGFPEGEDLLPGGVEVTRGAEFSLARQAPWLLNLGRRLTGRLVPGETTAAPAPEPTSPQPSASQSPAQPDATACQERGGDSGWRGRVTALASAAAWDTWMRTYRVASLSLYWLETAREVAAWAPDIVHANDANTLAPALWIKQHCGARLVYDSHELWLHRNIRSDRPVAPHVEAAIEKRGIAAADAVITVSPSIVDWLATHYRMERPPALVRNVPAAGPLPDRARGRLRELAGLPAEARVIAYGGRITTSRGIEETLQALALLPSDVHLVMLGYGDAGYIALLEALARQLGVAERVHRVGPVAPHEVADALSDGDVAVVHVRPTCLSYRFALPNKLFESIRAGLPVVAADLPDMAQVVRHYGVGEVFDGEEAEALAATLRAVLADPDRYREAARRACPELTWEREARTLIATYRRVLMGERA